MDYKEKANLLKVRKTVIEMLQDRSYEIDDETANVDIDQFVAMYDSENINFTVNDKIHIYFYIENKSFGKKDLTTIYSKVKTEVGPAIRLMIVINGKCIESIRNELNNLEYQNVEIFTQDQLRFNITKNYLVPKHTLLSEEDKQKVYKKYNATSNDVFQKIRKNDPVAQYYAMKKDDMCKIIRPSPSSGICISYRVVVL